MLAMGGTAACSLSRVCSPASSRPRAACEIHHKNLRRPTEIDPQWFPYVFVKSRLMYGFLYCTSYTLPK